MDIFIPIIFKKDGWIKDERIKNKIAYFPPQRVYVLMCGAR